MKAKEVREMPKAELEQKITTLKEELYNLRYQAHTGRLEKSGRIRNIRRDIARINTIIREKDNASTKQ